MGKPSPIESAGAAAILATELREANAALSEEQAKRGTYVLAATMLSFPILIGLLGGLHTLETLGFAVLCAGWFAAVRSMSLRRTRRLRDVVDELERSLESLEGSGHLPNSPNSNLLQRG